MRFLRFLLRFVGWLLTPLVAWAASFVGAWLGAQAARFTDDSTIGIMLSITGGAGFAVAATLLWMRTLRRSPELREVLAVTAEGIPMVAIEEPQPEEPSDAEPRDPVGT